MTKLIIELADDATLPAALAALGTWYGQQGLAAHGQWIKIGAGSSPPEFAWRITDMDVAHPPSDWVIMAARHLDPEEGVMRAGHVIDDTDVQALNVILRLVAQQLHGR